SAHAATRLAAVSVASPLRLTAPASSTSQTMTLRLPDPSRTGVTSRLVLVRVTAETSLTAPAFAFPTVASGMAYHWRTVAISPALKPAVDPQVVHPPAFAEMFVSNAS